MQDVPDAVQKVALLVNPTDVFLSDLLAAAPVDLLQLHGSETPERLFEIKETTGVPVMKALGVADQSDLAAIDSYADVADQILVDAKPPKGADLPGGNGLAFDWTLIANRMWSQPWMLAGGLRPDNARAAISRTDAVQLDVSSGVVVTVVIIAKRACSLLSLVDVVDLASVAARVVELLDDCLGFLILALLDVVSWCVVADEQNKQDDAEDEHGRLHGKNDPPVVVILKQFLVLIRWQDGTHDGRQENSSLQESQADRL